MLPILITCIITAKLIYTLAHTLQHATMQPKTLPLQPASFSQRSPSRLPYPLLGVDGVWYWMGWLVPVLVGDGCGLGWWSTAFSGEPVAGTALIASNTRDHIGPNHSLWFGSFSLSSPVTGDSLRFSTTLEGTPARVVSVWVILCLHSATVEAKYFAESYDCSWWAFFVNR